MLAKGRLLGIQFQELLKDDLYWDLAETCQSSSRKNKRSFPRNWGGFFSRDRHQSDFPDFRKFSN
jgi:threonine aldolase